MPSKKINQLRDFKNSFNLANEFIASFSSYKTSYLQRMIYDKAFDKDDLVVDICKKYEDWLAVRLEKVKKYREKLEGKLKKTALSTTKEQIEP